MSIEFIGHVFPHEMSETISRTGPVVQPDYLRALSQAHEASGFDKVLIPHSSSMVDGFILADQVLGATDRLGVLLAHRPGFVAPTQVARKYATIDAFHPGRIAMHVITGGDDADQVADALIEYVDAGATTLLIRGYEPYADAVRYGEVISIVRSKLAARDQDSALVGA